MGKLKVRVIMRIDDAEFKERLEFYLKEQKVAPFDSMTASMSFYVDKRRAFIELLRANGEKLEPALQPDPLERKPFKDWIKDHT